MTNSVHVVVEWPLILLSKFKKSNKILSNFCVLKIHELWIENLRSFSGNGQPFPQIPNILSPLTCFPDSSTFVEHHGLLALKVGVISESIFIFSKPQKKSTKSLFISISKYGKGKKLRFSELISLILFKLFENFYKLKIPAKITLPLGVSVKVQVL